MIDPAPWHSSGAFGRIRSRSARGEAFGGTDGEIRLQDRTYGTHVGKGGQSGDEWWVDLDTLREDVGVRETTCSVYNSI